MLPLLTTYMFKNLFGRAEKVYSSHYHDVWHAGSDSSLTCSKYGLHANLAAQTRSALL